MRRVSILLAVMLIGCRGSATSEETLGCELYCGDLGEEVLYCRTSQWPGVEFLYCACKPVLP